MGITAATMRGWFAGQTFLGPAGRQPYGKYVENTLSTLALVWAHTLRYGTVLHAGGHLGLMSLALATQFAHVHVIEAATDNYAWLTANIAGHPQIHATYGALGDGEPVTLVRHKYSACHHAQGPGEVPCYRIDDLVTAPLDVLLLDLEGGELVALHHAMNTLRRWHPLLIVEEVPKCLARYGRQPGEVTQFVAALGYRQVGASSLDLAFA